MERYYSPENELIPLDNLAPQKLNEPFVVHYTSLTTLFKILRNGTIRFNRIDNVNDLEEKDSLIINDNYRRVFIACFSYENSESIPMWRIYTTKETGVRLKIQLNDGYSVDDLIVNDWFEIDADRKLPVLRGISDDGDTPWRVKFDAFRITYVDKKRIPTTLEDKEVGGTFDVPDAFGMEKSTAWKYEKEIRLRAVIRPTTLNHSSLEDIGSLYGHINFNAINKLTITFNPWMEKDDWADILKDFVKKQKIEVPFEYRTSSLYNKIRM